MKPVKVTVDPSLSMDGLAIEACYEKSMLSDLEKEERRGNLSSGSGSMHGTLSPVLSEGRDDPFMYAERNEVWATPSDDRQEAAPSPMFFGEGGTRDDIEPNTSGQRPRSSFGSQSEDDFIEAEYEMVLDTASFVESPRNEAVKVNEGEGEDLNTSQKDEKNSLASKNSDFTNEYASSNEDTAKKSITTNLYDDEKEAQEGPGVCQESAAESEERGIEHTSSTASNVELSQTESQGSGEEAEEDAFGGNDAKPVEEPVFDVVNSDVEHENVVVWSEQDELNASSSSTSSSANHGEGYECNDIYEEEHVVANSEEVDFKQSMDNQRQEAKDLFTEASEDDENHCPLQCVSTAPSGILSTIVPLSTEEGGEEVMELVNQRRWSKLQEMIQDGTLEGSENRFVGGSFLHEICKNDPPVEIVKLWIASHHNDIETTDWSGCLPIHHACACRASIDVVDLLVDSYPESLMITDGDDKMLPLHYACREGADVEVLDFLLLAYPEGTLTPDANGLIPMDYAVNLKDDSTRSKSIVSLHKGIKQNITILSDLLSQSQSMLAEEQAKIAEMKQNSSMYASFYEQTESDNQSILNRTLEKLSMLEKNEGQRKLQIEDFNRKIEELESQLEETQLLLAAERKKILTDNTRELESTLKIEQCRNAALEQRLSAKQQLLDDETERCKDSEQKVFELEDQLSKVLKHKDELSAVKTDKCSLVLCEETPKAVEYMNIDRVHSSFEAENFFERAKQQAAIEDSSGTIQAKVQRNGEEMRALEESNKKKQEMIEIQQRKVEELERVQREKESLLQRNQEIVKDLEESIKVKLSLQRTEEEKIRQLEFLRNKKREMIQEEEEQVKKLDYIMGRKQALLELEEMKEKTLQQTIARKKALLEAETSKSDEIIRSHSEKEALLKSERAMIDCLAISKKDKEKLLESERILVEELYKAHAGKEAILHGKNQIVEDIQKKIKVAEALVEEERRLLDIAHALKEERATMIKEAEDAEAALEVRLSKKSIALARDRIISEGLEKFKCQRGKLAASGRLYSFVNTSLSISLLVKEAFLARQYERATGRQHPPDSVVAGAIVHRKVKSESRAPENILRKVIHTRGRFYMAQFAGFLGMGPMKTVRTKR